MVNIRQTTLRGLKNVFLFTKQKETETVLWSLYKLKMSIEK